MMWMLLIPLTVGLASALAVWGLRDWFYRRFNTDVAWIQSTWLRFNPDPPWSAGSTRCCWCVCWDCWR
jgi:hypothetical protein